VTIDHKLNIISELNVISAIQWKGKIVLVSTDGDWRHDDWRHDNGKGQKEAAEPPPPAYQPQHHRENVYKSRHLDLFKLIYSICSASLVELRLQGGPRALSGKKKEVRVKGVLKSVHLSVWNAPKGNQLGVNK